MIKYLLLCCLLCGSTSLWAQTTGGLYGKITDKTSDEGLIGVNIVLMDGDVQVAVATTDLSGNYNFSNVQAGTYLLVAMYISYPDARFTDLTISADQEQKFDIVMSASIDAPIIDVRAKRKIVDPTKPQVTKRDASFIKNNPERGLVSAITSTTGIGTPDEGEAFSSSGSRVSSNIVMINGVPVLNPNNIPLADLEVLEVQVMTSGIPARYGDATGSVTNIVTKGPSTKFNGAVQFESSQFLDNFGANTVNAFMSGPIIAKPIINALGDTLKRKGNVVKSSILGYRFSGAYFTTRDNRPSALSTFKLSDDKLAAILANPLMRSVGEGNGVVFTSDFLEQEDLEATNVRSNARNSSANFTTSIEFKPSSDFFLAVGAEGQFQWGKAASVQNQLFNYDFNPDQRSNNLNFTLRFRHVVSSTEAGNDTSRQEKRLMPVFQNLSYQLTGSYTQSTFTSEDPRYNDYWEYGYVGKFHESRRPVIDVLEENPILNSQGDTIGYLPQIGHAAFLNSFDAYEPNWDINPGLAAYNQLIPSPSDWRNPSLFDPNAPTSLNDMEMVNGLINNNRNSVYGLFNAPHITEEGFTKTSNNQIRASVQTNFELYTNQRSGNPMRHKIEVGGVFEQRIQRRYNINPFDLWNLAYQSANNHLSNATDASRPTGETYYDPNLGRTFDLYDALISTDAEGNEVPMSNFGANMRQALGLDKRDWIAVHELTPDQMDLQWFEPSTLITGQQRVIGYFGYDYLGNPLGNNVTFNDFFFETNENGVKTRPVAAFQPIYAAGYIQDQFIYKDVVFNIGVRFDSYDANTKILKDPYSITGYETAAEFEGDNSIYNKGRAPNYQRPANIGDDFAVYVSENSPDANVVGYRDGSQWYNASGLPINSPSELGSTTLPALKGFSTSEIDPQGENYDPNQAFEDYQPTVIVMPRISFSFPISPTSNFYANYDILSQRPPVGAFSSAYDYYNFRAVTTNGNRRINNSGLRPERTINYEVGFQQALTDFSKITLALVYKEERDLIQLREYIGAYPNTYTTFGNDDFSTTKIFKLEYETFRMKGLRIIANYALQFSEGTGSNPTSSAGVAAQELKYVFALDFDQRHTFYANLDYRFGSGDKYFGPKIGEFEVFGNMGFSFAVNANSGRPFTRKQIAGGIDDSFADRLTVGSVNGARMPWNFRMGIKIDRNLILGKNSNNPLMVNVFLRISNILNTQNILAVYAATGSPTDDGFLTSENGPGPGFAASQADSYELLYGLRNNNPYNISRPRRIFLGLNVSF
ncbi:MAG: carboxypeptidase regulatory-like domain-containing protein [Aureispira sp.]